MNAVIAFMYNRVLFWDIQIITYKRNHTLGGYGAICFIYVNYVTKIHWERGEVGIVFDKDLNLCWCNVRKGLPIVYCFEGGQRWKMTIWKPVILYLHFGQLEITDPLVVLGE